MKKIRFGLVALGVASLLGLGLGAGVASATPLPVTCTDGAVLVSGNTATVSHDTDSGDKGDWALDNFTRTTDVKVLSCAAHTYQVIVRDKGTFTTLPDGPSPRQGLPLPLTPFTGNFSGNTTYTVTSLLPPYSPTIAPIVGSPGTGSWWARFFHPSDGLKGSEDEFFSWTYTTACEKWVDANTDSDGAATTAGDITGKVCKTKPTPPPPTTTTVPPTTTTTAPPATTGVNGSGGSGSTGTVAQVSTVPVGAPQTGFGGAYVSNDEWLLFLFAGLAILGAVGATVTVFAYRRRERGTRVTS